MNSEHALDPHERPPGYVRSVYKKYQKMKREELDRDADIMDFGQSLSDEQRQRLILINRILPDEMNDIFCAFEGSKGIDNVGSPVLVYEHSNMPGLIIAPTLLPPRTQLTLLSRLLHRDLSSPTHLTNIHTHYTIAYPPSHRSFFTHPPKDPTIVADPLDPSLHRPISISPFLSRKLRWITLGGQYDWTVKAYPSSPPPSFPLDIKSLLESLFPETKAEAAIVNLYSPGDTLSVHRDVSEACSNPLISVSLGCEGIFVIGNRDREDKEKVVVLRLPSGSAVYMSGDSRFAWHGIPQVLAGTCPEYLQHWPAVSSSMETGFEDEQDKEGLRNYEAWKGWMAGKRINLNVRQMWS